MSDPNETEILGEKAARDETVRKLRDLADKISAGASTSVALVVAEGPRDARYSVSYGGADTLARLHHLQSLQVGIAVLGGIVGRQATDALDDVAEDAGFEND